MAQLVQILLTCPNWEQAQQIADALLDKKLAACIEQTEIKSKNWWKGELESQNEIRLMMETVAANFDKIEAEVRKLHSYDTFVMQMIPVLKVSKDVEAWILENTKSE